MRSLKVVLTVAVDLLREAASRRWFLALGVAITALLTFIGLFLKLEVVDGALAGVRLFGNALTNTISSADVALRPVFGGAIFVIFYGGVAFMVLACADFAPSLLSPGRIEHLLSLPVRRWQLLFGTYLGVMVLAVVCALYGSAGLCLILGAKTGYWTAAPLLSSLMACVAFGALYAGMLASSLFVRSTALSAATGAVLYVFGIVAGFRADLAPLFDEGFGRTVFKLATAIMPRTSMLALLCAKLSAGVEVDLKALAGLLAGMVVFAAALLSVAVWRFEEKDF